MFDPDWWDPPGAPTTRTRVVGGVLGVLRLPMPLVIVAEGWSSPLVTALSLNLPVAALFGKSEVLSPLQSHLDAAKISILPLISLSSVRLPYPRIVVISGSDTFLLKLRRLFGDESHLIWFCDQNLVGIAPSTAKRQLFLKSRACTTLCLTPVYYPHRTYGGATTAVHLVAYSAGFGHNWNSFKHPPDVARSIAHAWSPAAKVRFRLCQKGLEPLSGAHHKVLWSDKAVRIEGLLPIWAPNSYFIGPSVYQHNRLVSRRLTSAEYLHVFDMPSKFHSAFLDESWNTRERFPFFEAISPTITASIFRHLWSCEGGVQCNIEGPAAVSGLEAPLQLEPPLPTGLADYDDLEGQNGFDGKIAASFESTEDKEHYLRSISDLSWADNSCPPPHIDEVEVRSDQPLADDTPRQQTTACPWDTDSDEDSLMPRRRKETSSNEFSVLTWEYIDDDLSELFKHSEGNAKLPENDDDSQLDLSTVASNSEWSTASECTVKSSVTRSSVKTYDTTSTYATASSNGTTSEPESRLAASKESLEAITKATAGLKATKEDEAPVPVYLWDERILGPNPEERKLAALTGFREFGLRMFWKGLRLDCIDHLRRKFGSAWASMDRKSPDGKKTKLGHELDAISNLMWHATETSWFEYTAGSRVYHFRFPIRYQKLARDGVPIYFETPGPDTLRPQPGFSDEGLRAKVKPKVEKVIRRRYMIRSGIKLKSLIKYFAVPKGEKDVRIVYDATASGLNETVWAPSFWLPTIDSLVRALDADSWMSDRDIGDMFLNFQLHKSAWPFAGVDIKPILDEAGEPSFARWYHWVRNAMGFAPSPYNSIKIALIAEEVIRGDRHDPDNPFSWACVQLNLPGSIDYDPSISWIRKVREDLLAACELFTFVDDERVKGATRELTWQASHRLAAIQSYLGIQDAARKVGLCMQQPRAWAGAVVHVLPGEGIYVLTSEEKWLKMKRIIAKWSDVLDQGTENLNHKELLSDRGFLVYVTRAYPSMIPYIKGFHLTAEMWRGNRDNEGWKLPVTERFDEKGKPREEVDEQDDDDEALKHRLRHRVPRTLHAPPSGLTPPAPRLREDLRALTILTAADSPPLRLVRPKKIYQVYYGFGDASGKGRGSTFQAFKTVHHPSNSLGAASDVIYRVGVWGSDAEDESSNYRELTNVVEEMEEEAKSGRMVETEVFMCTDNSTAESAYYKGSSSSKILHELILRLHKLALDYCLIIHLIHVAGKRMIAQGTDGCSRGVLMEGVMAGKDMLSFFDLNKSAFERYLPLLWWIRSWCPDNRIAPLTPEEWFEKGHGIVGGHLDKKGVWMPDHEPSGKVHLWAPPPAIADAMLEQLLMARHKRTDTTHIVIIPRLFGPRWRRLFHKACDVTFVVPPGASFWPTDMYEPLWIGVLFPFIPHRPWCLKRAPLMVEMGWKLRQVCKESDFLAGHILRKLFKLTRRLATLPESVACGLLHVPRSRRVSNVFTHRR